MGSTYIKRQFWDSPALARKDYLLLPLSIFSRAKKAHKHKEAHRKPPIWDPTLKFFMWGPLLLENKAKGATHIKNLGLHWGPLHSLCGYFFMCFFRLPILGEIQEFRPCTRQSGSQNLGELKLTDSCGARECIAFGTSVWCGEANGPIADELVPFGCADFERELSGPISRDVAIVSLRYPLSRDTFSAIPANPQQGAIPPLWCLVFHRDISAIPHFAAYCAIFVRYPRKTSTKEFCDTIAESIARYEKYRCWAS